MPSAAPRRRAERPGRERRAPKPARAPKAEQAPRTPREPRSGGGIRDRIARVGASRLPISAWSVVVLAGVGCLVAAMVPVGPDLLPGIGSVAIAGAFAWALAARTGGRPVLFGMLAVACGIGVLVADDDSLRTGAAVMTCAIGAVLGVVATVPARTFLGAARECVIAVLIAAIGALATAGFEPTITLVRFEYVTLVLALAGSFLVVFRLGAGFHGLGRRGVAVVLIGGVLLAVTLAYAELLRRYGTPELVDTLLDGVRWSRDHLGAFPRPIETVLGVPALVWGTHMRARRRQGWWVCAFGAAATAPVANSLMNPAISLLEVGLSVGYGLVIGLLIGYVVVRLDLLLTGPRGSRARRAEELAAVRPEPPRTRALL